MSNPAHDPRIGIISFEIRKAPPVAPLSEQQAAEYLVEALAGGPAGDAARALDKIETSTACRAIFEAAARSQPPSEQLQDAVHTAWSVRGFRLREALADDRLLISALRALLPPYCGPGLTLFRGEQTRLFETGCIGLNWTPKREIAAMFAQGLCTTYPGGGVLLEASAPPSAVIAAPGRHSINLGEHEHVVDPQALTHLTELERFPETDDAPQLDQ